MSKLQNVLEQSQMALVVVELLEANNTATTLEVKNELRDRFPEQRWIQKDVSNFMAELAEAGDLTFVDNGTFRTYSLKVKRNKKGKLVTTPTKKAMKPAAVPTSRAKKPATPAVKATRISRKKALELMLGNKGHFFTAEFVKKDGVPRVINCQCLKDQSDSKLGYVKVREAALMRSATPEKAIRNINMQTITSLKIGGKVYKVI